MYGLVVESIDADHCVATWDRVVLSCFRGRMSAASVGEMRHAARTLERSAPKGVALCFVSVVERSSPPPPDDVRRDLSEFFRSVQPTMAQIIIVPEGGGFRAALVRGVGVALSTLAPKALPFSFADTVPAACRLVEPHLSPAAGGATNLANVVEQLRRSVGKHATRE